MRLRNFLLLIFSFTIFFSGEKLFSQEMEFPEDKVKYVIKAEQNGCEVTVNAIIEIEKNDETEIIKNIPIDQTALMIKAFYEDIMKITKCSFNFERELLSQARVMEAVRLSNNKKKFITLEEIN